MTVEFRLLGHVEAAVDGTPLPIGCARLRCVLAVLLVEANHPVSVDHGLGRGQRDDNRQALTHAAEALRWSTTAGL